MANDESKLVNAKDLPPTVGEKPPELTEAQGRTPLRLRDIEWMMEAVAKGVNEAITKATLPLQARIAELESRQVRYLGVWRENKVYSVGSMCTDHGSLWHCDRATMTRPAGSNDWTLCVKRGAPGKSAS